MYCKLVRKNCHRSINTLYYSIQKKINFENYINLIKILKDVFGDPNKKITSPKIVIMLCKQNQPFYEYQIEFQKYTPKTRYSIKAKISFLMAELSVELQSQIIYHDISKLLNKYAMFLQTLDHNDYTMQKNLC